MGIDDDGPEVGAGGGWGIGLCVGDQVGEEGGIGVPCGVEGEGGVLVGMEGMVAVAGVPDLGDHLGVGCNLVTPGLIGKEPDAGADGVRTAGERERGGGLGRVDAEESGGVGGGQEGNGGWVGIEVGAEQVDGRGPVDEVGGEFDANEAEVIGEEGVGGTGDFEVPAVGAVGSDGTNAVEVLGVGPQQGQERSQEEKKDRGWSRDSSGAHGWVD